MPINLTGPVSLAAIKNEFSPSLATNINLRAFCRAGGAGSGIIPNTGSALVPSFYVSKNVNDTNIPPVATTSTSTQQPIKFSMYRGATGGATFYDDTRNNTPYNGPQLYPLLVSPFSTFFNNVVYPRKMRITYVGPGAGGKARTSSGTGAVTSYHSGGGGISALLIFFRFDEMLRDYEIRAGGLGSVGRNNLRIAISRGAPGAGIVYSTSTTNDQSYIYSARTVETVQIYNVNTGAVYFQFAPANNLTAAQAGTYTNSTTFTGGAGARLQSGFTINDYITDASGLATTELYSEWAAGENGTAQRTNAYSAQYGGIATSLTRSEGVFYKENDFNYSRNRKYAYFIAYNDVQDISGVAQTGGPGRGGNAIGDRGVITATATPGNQGVMLVQW